MVSSLQFRLSTEQLYILFKTVLELWNFVFDLIVILFIVTASKDLILYYFFDQIKMTCFIYIYIYIYIRILRSFARPLN